MNSSFMAREAKSASTPVLLADSVSFGFESGHRVLSDISFDLARGEAVALLGENGAGKSTLLNLCLGYLAPTAGSIRVLNEDPAKATAVMRASTAYVPETARLYPTMSGLELIRFFGQLTGRRPTDKERNEALERVGFPLNALRRASSTYSKGMRQKIVLALGLLKGARVFFLDEPTSGLDPQSQRELASAVQRLASVGSAVLFTTHDNSLAAAAATRSLRIEAGCVVGG